MTHVKKRVAWLTAFIIGFATVGAAPSFALDERVIDIVEVTWPGAVAPVADATKMADVVNKDVNTDWKIFTTLYGDTKDRVVSFSAGKVLKAPIQLLGKMPCTGSAAGQFIDSIRPEAYSRLGISNNSNRYLLVVSPKAGCIWSGRAQLGDKNSKNGTLIIQDTASSFVISHELGHTFGLGHSNFLRCENAAYDGAWSDICKGVEYGGAIDVMGNIDTRSPLSTYHQWRMGLIDDSQIKQVWKSEVVTLAPSDFAEGIKAIFIRDGKAAYWIEYRRKIDGATYKPGLAIYRLDPPPATSVVTPNTSDDLTSFGNALGTDLWLLNLDTYQYRDSKSVGGSMTALTASTYSGKVSFSAVPSETQAVVTITKKVEASALPIPELVPVDQWKSPNMTILKKGDEVVDTALVGFEGSINGVVQSLKASDIDGWIPTFLNPFIPPKTLYVRDLPEGSYNFALRTIDIVGNKSEWSPTVKVTIDRADPVVTNSFAVSAISPTDISVAWKGATDAGSGICEASVVDEDGLVVQTSTTKNSPTLKLEIGSTLSGNARVFDCIGNGLSGELTMKHIINTASKGTKTGKWSSVNTYGAGAMKCIGKCTISFSVSGIQDVVVGTGTASVAISGKTVATITDNKSAKPRIGTTINVGENKKVVRLSGSNFVVVGLSSLETTLGSLKEYDRAPAVIDTSLSDAKQIKLSKYGFRADDFSQEWTVLPMARGTTLDDPTLDLCNAKFDSEKGRAERRQMSVVKSGSTFAFLSSEVVRYESVDAANTALKELKKVLEDCKSLGGFKDATGAISPYTFRSLPTLPATVVSESNRVFVHATIGSGAESRQMLAFYQFNGDLFTGLYILTASENPFTDAQVAKWVKVAATMGQRLQGK